LSVSLDDTVSTGEGETMRKVVLYRLVTDENGKSHYVRVKGRKRPEGRLGSYYLRYRENGKRKWESVGDDLALAEQEQKARQASLNSTTPLTIISEQKTLRKEVQKFLTNKSESWRYILAVFGDFHGWDKDPANFQHEDFKAYAAHLAKNPIYKDGLERAVQAGGNLKVFANTRHTKTPGKARPNDNFRLADKPSGIAANVMPRLDYNYAQV
jgi:hypothetical protein